MCIFGRQSKKEQRSVSLLPKENEFWLMQGVFRDWLADQSKVGYYGLCAYSEEAICPPGERSSQDQFYQLVCNVIKRSLHDAPSVVLVEDFSHSKDWDSQKGLFRQLTLHHAGKLFEEYGPDKDCYAFVFPAIPNTFLSEIFWWMAEHTCTEDIYVQYSSLDKTDFPFSSITEIKKKTTLNLLIDDVHPVLILQLAYNYPVEQISTMLRSSCDQDGWSFFLK